MCVPQESSSKYSALRLIRAGFTQLERGRQLCEQLDALGIDGCSGAAMLEACPHSADPDTALYYCVQIASSSEGAQILRQGLTREDRTTLMCVLGASEAVGRSLVAHPQFLHELIGLEPLGGTLPSRQQMHDMMHDSREHAAQGAINDAVTAMRLAYRNILLRIMAVDATAADPVSVQPHISQSLTDAADCAIDTAFFIAQHSVELADTCRFAVIGMGKCGAQELNYVSDVDVIYVVEPGDGEQAPRGERLIRLGTKIATTMQRYIQDPIVGVSEPPLWQIDTALRPEGKDGPLVRTLQSHLGYYEQWAESWEFQALLKARAIAGDAELGAQYIEQTRPMVWAASQRPNFVHDCQTMRQRVESLIPPQLKDREIKLGKGGLRDVEFTVQMLQLVHGRTDAQLHVAGTLPALQALSAGGYVSRKQASELAHDYSFERVLEHRMQMWSLKRTHLFPDLGAGSVGGLETPRQIEPGSLDTNIELRRLARAVGMLPDQLVERYDATRQRIRQLHLDIYYRPMLPNIAQLGDSEITLSPEATKARFEAIGFADPDSAMRHVQALTAGLNRAAKINRIILPAVLQWLASGQNPDMGLLAWRKLEEQFGQGSEYLGFLRDSQSAGRRLCHILSNSRFLGDAISKSMESLTWLGNNELLAPRSRNSLETQAYGAVSRYASKIEDIATALRAMRRQEIERIGLGWMSGVIDDAHAISAMSDVVDVIIDAALRWSIQSATEAMGLTQGADAPARLAIIGLGRYGGREVNFCSDADAMIIYEPQLQSQAQPQAQSQQQEQKQSHDNGALPFAKQVVNDLRKILMGPISREPALELDLDLRPEGKNGPLVRSLQSCREYYEHWASTWERQALLRARYAAGDQALAAAFITTIADPMRYPTRKLDEHELSEIRTLKARMEAERLPRGVAKDRHVKLGKGGLSDAEWTIQLLQLQYAHEYADLRVTGTLDALHALVSHHCIEQEDARVLEMAWTMATNARNAHYIWSGNAHRCDILPDDTYSLGGIAAVLGYPAHHGQEFESEILAAMRRCREVMERLFYAR